MNPAADFSEEITYDAIAELRGEDAEGPIDHICPICSAERSTQETRNKPVMRSWDDLAPGIFTFNCCRCGIKGHVCIETGQPVTPRKASRAPKPKKEHDLH